MQLDAVTMAADRLQMAEEALEDLKQAGDFRAAEKAWTSFLVAAGAFYSKLDTRNNRGFCAATGLIAGMAESGAI